MNNLLAAVSVYVNGKPYIYIFGSGGTVERYDCEFNTTCRQPNTIFGYSIGANGAFSAHLNEIKNYIKNNNPGAEIKQLFEEHADRILGVYTPQPAVDEEYLKQRLAKQDAMAAEAKRYSRADHSHSNLPDPPGTPIKLRNRIVSKPVSTEPFVDHVTPIVMDIVLLSGTS